MVNSLTVRDSCIKINLAVQLNGASRKIITKHPSVLHNADSRNTEIDVLSFMGHVAHRSTLQSKCFFKSNDNSIKLFLRAT